MLLPRQHEVPRKRSNAPIEIQKSEIPSLAMKVGYGGPGLYAPVGVVMAEDGSTPKISARRRPNRFGPPDVSRRARFWLDIRCPVELILLDQWEATWDEERCGEVKHWLLCFDCRFP